MSSFYDEEIQKRISTHIVNGDVLVHKDNRDFFEEIEINYPTSFNKIDWDQKGYILYKKITEKNKIEEFYNLLTFISHEYPEISSDRMIIFGDDLIDYAYEMEYTKFISLFDIFIEIPQHTYILFKENKKCINLTFEDEFFFG